MCSNKVKTVSSTEEETVKNKKSKNTTNRNVIRDFCNILTNNTKPVLGMYYMIIHTILIYAGIFIILFTNNIIHLTILLIIASFDAFSIVVLHNCPLTMLEQKYLGTSCVNIRKQYLKKQNILYKCNHEYEKQLEFLINVWCIISAKIMFLILMEMGCIVLKKNNGII